MKRKQLTFPQNLWENLETERENDVKAIPKDNQTHVYKSF